MTLIQKTSNYLLNPLHDFFGRARVYRRTRNELRGLTDRELADIGINRYDIDDVARNQALTVFG